VRFKVKPPCCREATHRIAAGIEPIDTVCTNFKDSEGLFRESQAARRAGFTGKVAIHPDQVEPINRAFTHSAEEIAYARRVVQAFSAGVGRWRSMPRCSTCHI
jgi:citrate lyase subunit beta / citryl-CoA lyase